MVYDDLFLPEWTCSSLFPHPLRRLNLPQVLIGDSAPGKLASSSPDNAEAHETRAEIVIGCQSSVVRMLAGFGPSRAAFELRYFERILLTRSKSGLNFRNSADPVVSYFHFPSSDEAEPTGFRTRDASNSAIQTDVIDGCHSGIAIADLFRLSLLGTILPPE